MKKKYWNLYRTQDNGPWPKIGVAFQNKDGSYNLRFRGAVNVADKLQMREPRLKEQAKEQVKQQGAEAGAA